MVESLAEPMLWVLWNLFLAVIPVALGAAAGAVGDQMRRRRDQRLWLALAPLLLLWLAFLPNSCYLFTELRHFLEAVDRQDLWFRAHGNRNAMVEFVVRAALGFVYVTAGALTFALAIRPIRKLARDAGITLWLLSPLFFIVIALGVYLGLVLRYNSWHLFTRTDEVLRTAFAVTDRPRLTLAIVLFGLFLWGAYEVIDIWIDGFVLRWSRLTRPASRQDEPLPAMER